MAATAQAPADTGLPWHLPLQFVPAETDEFGESFDVWVVKRSFTHLAPICRLGLGLVVVFLLVVDPAYHFLGLWSPAVPLGYLVIWHVATAIFFIVGLLASQRVATHASRLRTLVTFFNIAAVLFVLFGVISWLATGDLSTIAIAQLLMAAVFTLPGTFRRWIYGLQALTLGLLLAWLDSNGKFLGQRHFINLMVLAGVAFVVDGYMSKTARTLFSQQCQVASERRRADSVLYNALPLAMAEELKSLSPSQSQKLPGHDHPFCRHRGFHRVRLPAFTRRSTFDPGRSLLGNGRLDRLTSG